MARNGLAHSEPYLWNGTYMMLDGKLLHRSTWEAEHGAIPDGHYIHHVNGDRLDNRLDNLSLITSADHCKLHRPRLGYRAPVKTVCRVCGGDRNEVEINSDPSRRVCNKCRGKRDRDRRKGYVTSIYV